MDNLPSGLVVGKSDYSMREVVLTHQIETKVPSREQWSLNQVIRNGELSVFTDGSKTNSGVGAGFFCEELHLEKSVKLGESCTVFQAVLALKAAADYLLEANIRKREISLYVDSQAAITAVGNCTVGSKLVISSRKVIHALSQHNSLRICWVPGHSNYLGNEEADRLAKFGSDDPDVTVSNEAEPPIGFWKK